MSRVLSFIGFVLLSSRAFGQDLPDASWNYYYEANVTLDYDIPTTLVADGFYDGASRNFNTNFAWALKTYTQDRNPSVDGYHVVSNRFAFDIARGKPRPAVGVNMGGQMDTAMVAVENMVGASPNDPYAPPGGGFGRSVYDALYGQGSSGARGWLLNPGGIIQNPAGVFGERVARWSVHTWSDWGAGSSAYGIMPAGTALVDIPQDLQLVVTAVRDALGWLVLGLCGVGAVRIVIEGAGGG